MRSLPPSRFPAAATCVLLAVPLASCGSDSNGSSSPSADLVAFSLSDPLSATIDLGRKLIFDPRLSRPRGVSCGMCHDPFLGWGDGRPQGKGIQDNTLAGDVDGNGSVDHEPTLAVAGNRYKTRLTPRNTPTIYNSHLFPNLFWDGRSGDLVHQAQFPVEAGVEMNSSWDDHVLPLLQSDPDYVAAFDSIWGEAPSRVRAIEAMGAYEATISVFDTPYDAFLAGDESALTADQRAGHDLFFGKAGCGDCHTAPLLTDFSFANTGVPNAGVLVLEGTVDLGRGQFSDLTQDPPVDIDNPADYAKFKTPQLRMVSETGPYMHNGAFHTLAEVVEFYDQGGGPDLSGTGTKDPRIVPLGLTATERSQLVAFLEGALTGTVID